MKVVILAGGLGTRLSEYTENIPKPMVNIGRFPVLWHIMKIYNHYGFDDFIVACGYKAEYIKNYFMNYYAYFSDTTIDLATGKFVVHIDENTLDYNIHHHKMYSTPYEVEVHKTLPSAGLGDRPFVDWKVTVADTGLHTMTGGRVKRLADFIGDERFCLTYGDGVGNIDIAKELEFHKQHGKLCTMTVVHPPARFGTLKIDDGRITSFKEKSQAAAGWINGGFFIMEPETLKYFNDDDMPIESEPLDNMVKDDQLMAFEHDGFWHPMDTKRDVEYLNQLWDEKKAPWEIFD